MGMETVVLGYLAEPWVARDGERNRLFRRWNRRTLAELPDRDTWPPLCRGLFGRTEVDPLRGGYRGGVIHFGGRFKSIEQEWDEWLVKFESLLRRMYWESSTVYLETELAGSFRFARWLGQWDGLLETPPRFASAWEFCGPFRKWSEVT